MSAENTIKVTCDGCGVSRSFVTGDNIEGHPLWYSLDVEVKFNTVGQGVRANPGVMRLDACSKACAAKAVSKCLPPLPGAS